MRLRSARALHESAGGIGESAERGRRGDWRSMEGVAAQWMDGNAAACVGWWQVTLRDAGNWALFALAIVVVAFTLLYVFRSSDGWKHNRVGGVYLAKSIVLLQISASVLSSSEYWGRDIVRLVVYSVDIVAYLWMMKSLPREQRNDRLRRRRDRGDELPARPAHNARYAVGHSIG